ncbi:MAG: hypothetical protein H6835_01170 [Planctomycetes bacterium]|nr:hypothetical protein [Planctomycetota bacterium]
MRDRPAPLRSPLLTTFAAGLLFALASCSGGELVGVHVRLAADGSGTLTTRALLDDQPAAPAEPRAAGVQWDLRASLVASQGTFTDIGQLKLGDGGVTFTPQLDGERPGLRVTLARGPKTPWIETLVPDQPTRRRLAKAYDPTGRTKEIADVLRIEVQAPGAVITSGVLPNGRGVTADREGDRAFLLLPLRTALEEGDPFVWDISWMKRD